MITLLIMLGGGYVLYKLMTRPNSRPAIGNQQQAGMLGGRRQAQLSFQDAAFEARQMIERLGGQVLSLAGNDAASTQALADASERYNAASSQIAQAQTVRQAEIARESALEGLYYVQAAREIMGLPAGPPLPELMGQKRAGRVTETRTVDYEGQQLTASPVATAATPNYYPGGMVAGRPVPAGWYSRPWWADAMVTGMWSAASFMMFSSLFHSMSGVGYGADAFASGYGNGYDAGFAAGQEFGGGDYGTGELGSGDFGGGDVTGGDSGGFFDGGLGDSFDFGGFDGFDI